MFTLKLKVTWFKNFLGLAIDQVSLNQKYFLTSYYFWPKTDAWEQLKSELDAKPWLTTREKNKILKNASEVMNYWLSYRDNAAFENFKEKFPEVEVTILTD